VKIIVDSLFGEEVVDLLQEHIDDMKSISPPESKHALDLDSLKQPNITFWSVWDAGTLAGFGAIQKLDDTHAEVKSMRTSRSYKQKGVATALLQHIISESKGHGFLRLSLETGSMPYFEPAHRLYEKHGFQFCDPFSDYKEDPYSRFMTKEL